MNYKINNNRIVILGILLMLLYLTFYISKIENYGYKKGMIISILVLSISNNLITIYLSIELFTYIIIYILLSNNFYKESNKSRWGENMENIFQYFILNSSSSIFFIFSIYFSYRYTGTIIIDYIILDSNNNFLVFFFFILFFFFKLSNFPYYFYIYTIYPNLPYKTYYIIYSIPTIYILSICNILNVFKLEKKEIINILILSIFISILISIYLGINNTNLLQYLAFSSMYNINIIFISLFIYSIYPIHITIYYMIYYIITLNTIFIYLYYICPLLYNFNIWPYLMNNKHIIILTIILFNLIGIPPTMGFYSKLYLLSSLSLYLQYTFTYYIFYFIFITTILTTIYYLYPIIFFNIFPIFSPSRPLPHPTLSPHSTQSVVIKSHSFLYSSSILLSISLNLLLFHFIYLPYFLSFLIIAN